MIVTLSVLLGALFGGLKAKRRGGTGMDVAQYAGTYAVVFGIVGVIVTVIILRMAT